MRAGEWISWYDSMGEWPDSGNMETDRFYATAIDNADVIIRDLLAEVERLNRVFVNQGNLREEIVDLKRQLQAAQALAATHLADQELLMARERKRVARECIDYVNNHANDCGCSKRIAHDIRTHYGVD